MKTIMKRVISKAPLAAAVATVMAIPMQTHAQVLEEVVVTAQKRVESLQDVPISITAVTGDKMAEAGIFKIEDLQTLTPNLSMTETGISTQIYIRGIGTGNNQGFEQSVGQYVDGIYYGRQQLLRMPFLDLERVEVLRGPQSILFGKNSIAGALNMTTAKPSDEFGGSFSLKYAPEYDITEVTGIITGPISETVAGRLAVRKYDEDGWMDNSFKNEDEVERDDLAVRASLQWNPTDELQIDFKVERDEFDGKGRQIEIVQDDPAIAGPFAGLNFDQALAALGYPDAITEIKQDNERQVDTPDWSKNELENYTLNVEYELGDLTLTSTTGYVTYEFEELNDLDFIGAPVFEGLGEEEYEQFSQEIRLVSPGGETVDWIAGAFYQSNELDYSDHIRIFENTVLAVANPAAAAIRGTEATRIYESDSELWAVFAQATWNINETLRLTAGGRYTSEEKEGKRQINILDTATGQVAANPAAALVFAGGFGIESEQTTGHNLDGDRDESIFTPLVNLQWDYSDDIMIYISWSTGFKSGGFDARANVTGSWEFEEEEATTYEIGAKTTLLDGAAEFNIALYRTEYDDLQVSQFDGVLGFTVGNAKETVVQGVEIDGRWALTDNLILSYGLAYLDHEFEDFQNGNCYNRQTPDGAIVNGVQLCDYSGKRGQYTPEWTGNLSLNHEYQLSDGLELRSTIDVSYTDEQNTHVNLDPTWNVDSMTQVNLRVGIYAEQWDVSLLAQNITDEQQFTYVGNTPLSGSSFGTNTFYSFMSRPQTTYLQFNYKF